MPRESTAAATRPFKFPWVTLGVCATGAWLQWIGSEHLAASLEYQRSSIFAGEFWRLWTGHLVHYSAAQLLIDASVLLVCGAYVERRLGSGAMLVCAGLIPPAISMFLLAVDPALQSYRGASALSSAAAALAACMRWNEHPPDRPWILSAALLFMLELTCVACGASVGLGSLPPGIPVAWRAHAFGVLLAVLGDALHLAKRPAA